MIILAIKIFFVAFFLNLLYELLHSLLYTTCLKASLKRYIYLMLKASLFDGFVITLFYVVTFLLSPRHYSLLAFVVINLLFAYFWEIYSLKAGKWEYSAAMPKILGVGVTPLLQLALTAIISICTVSYFFV